MDCSNDREDGQMIQKRQIIAAAAGVLLGYGIWAAAHILALRQRRAEQHRHPLRGYNLVRF